VLKESIPAAHQLSKIKPKIQECKQKKDAIWAELKEVKKVVSEREQEIEALRKEIEGKNEAKAENKAKGDAITKEIEDVAELINKQFAAKDSLRDEFFKAKYDFEVQRDFIYHVQDLQKRKDSLAEREKEKVED
jgi:chromosome segregation ATPase